MIAKTKVISVSTLAVLTVNSLFASPVLASSVSSEGGCSAQSVENATSMTLLDSHESSKYIDLAKSKITSGEFVANAPVKLSDAKVYKVNAGSSSGYSVTFQLEGDYSYLSNFTVLIDTQGNVSTYSETQIGLGESGNFKIVSYQDGQLVNTKETPVPYMADDELQSSNYRSSTASASTPQSVGGTVACVASVLGISGAVGYIIVSACSGACTAVATGVGGVVCAACIGAYATVGGASIGAVASCFK